MQWKTWLLGLWERNVLIFAFLELKDTSSNKKNKKRANSKVKRKQKDKTKNQKWFISNLSKEIGAWTHNKLVLSNAT